MDCSILRDAALLSTRQCSLFPVMLGSDSVYTVDSSRQFSKYSTLRQAWPLVALPCNIHT